MVRHFASSLLALVLVSLPLLGCGDDDGGTEADRRGIGATCQVAEDCFEADQACLTQFTGGYCGRMDCLGDVDCPPGSACVQSGGQNYCFRICLDKIDCNRHRPPAVEANCSSNLTFVEGTKGRKVCVPPSSGS